MCCKRVILSVNPLELLIFFSFFEEVALAVYIQGTSRLFFGTADLILPVGLHVSGRTTQPVKFLWAYDPVFFPQQEANPEDTGDPFSEDLDPFVDIGVHK